VPYRSTPRTEARRQAARARLIDAAEAQMAADGYASASVAAVADRAGVATGTVYRHFAAKAELLAEVYRRRAADELALARGVTGDRRRPARERIAAAVEAFARRALAGPVLARAMIAEPVDPELERERAAFRRAYRDVLAGVLEDGVAAGELAPLDVPTAAAALVGAIGEALVGPLSPGHGGRPGGEEALVLGLVHFCLNAITTPEAPNVDDRVPRRSDASHA